MVSANGAAQLLTIGGIFIIIAHGLATTLLLLRRGVSLRAYALGTGVGMAIALPLVMLGMGWPLRVSTLIVAVALWALYMAISVLWFRVYEKHRGSAQASDTNGKR